MQIVDLDIEAVRPNPQNPNVMDSDAFKALLSEIKERGFVQPVLVREVEVDSANPRITHELVDGEHRWRALRSLGAESVPCVVAEDDDDTEALLRMITMNRFRGQFLPVRLASLIADLRTRVDEEELRGRLAMSTKEWAHYVELAEFGDDVLDDPPGSEDEEEEEPGDRTVEMVVVATPDQADRINTLLEELTDGNEEREATAMAKAAREYGADD